MNIDSFLTRNAKVDNLSDGNSINLIQKHIKNTKYSQNVSNFIISVNEK